MYYKTLPETETYNKLQKLHEKVISTKEKIREVLKSMGYKDFGTSQDFLVKCCAVYITGPKPEGWKSLGGMYYLPKSKSKFRSIISELPFVDNEELNDIVNFSWQVGSDLCIYNRPGWNHCEGYSLIEIGHGCKYTPNPDMIEITGSEYKQLYENIKPNT